MQADTAVAPRWPKVVNLHPQRWLALELTTMVDNPLPLRRIANPSSVWRVRASAAGRQIGERLSVPHPVRSLAP